jgi:putative transposase
MGAVKQVGIRAVQSTKQQVPYTFSTIPWEYKDCEKWPSAMTPTAKQLKLAFPKWSTERAEVRAIEISERFDRLAKAIRAYMVKGSLKAALAEGKCGREAFYRALNRCLMHDSSGESIVGWAGLIENLRLKQYTRVATGAGTAGIFTQWIKEATEWRNLLHRMILQGNGGKSIAARKPDVRGVVKNFIAAFTKPNKGELAPIPLGEYPHDGRSNARRSLERYVNNFIAMSPEATSAWFGEDVANRQHLGTGLKSVNYAVGPFDILGTDAHTFDAVGFVILPGPSGPQKVPVTRIILVANICINKKVVTGYSVCLRPQIESGHVEEAYLMGSTPWEPKQLTIEGLAYDQGAGFPCGSVEGISEVNPGAVRLDNAAQHYAKGIRNRLRRSLACAVMWGGVGHWWRNAVVERFFGTLERSGFQRVSSSMGSGTQDPHRAKNPALEATGRGIEWDELVQLADVLLANYNARPHSALGGVSPLDSLRSSLHGSRSSWYPRTRAPVTANSPRVGWQILHKRIAGSVESRVPPYVEVGEQRYTSPKLSAHYDWLGRDVHVHVPKDMRTVEVFLSSGEFIGELTVQDRGWALTPHSMQIRQEVNKLIRAGEMHVPSGGDPIVAFMDHLTAKAASKAAGQRIPKVSGEASAVAELARITGLVPTGQQPQKDSADQPSFTLDSVPGFAMPEGWE